MIGPDWTCSDVGEDLPAATAAATAAADIGSHSPAAVSPPPGQLLPSAAPCCPAVAPLKIVVWSVLFQVSCASRRRVIQVCCVEKVVRNVSIFNPRGRIKAIAFLFCPDQSNNSLSGWWIQKNCLLFDEPEKNILPTYLPTYVHIPRVIHLSAGKADTIHEGR